MDEAPGEIPLFLKKKLGFAQRKFDWSLTQIFP
jgi:hypothetical protein